MHNSLRFRSVEEAESFLERHDYSLSNGGLLVYPINPNRHYPCLNIFGERYPTPIGVLSRNENGCSILLTDVSDGQHFEERVRLIEHYNNEMQKNDSDSKNDSPGNGFRNNRYLGVGWVPNTLNDRITIQDEGTFEFQGLCGKTIVVAKTGIYEVVKKADCPIMDRYLLHKLFSHN